MTVTPYHRGDLPDALVRAAIELLDEDGGASGLSLRAAARRAGVSAAAPYRHFSDRTSLLSAVAAVGYRELVTTLEGAHPAPEDPGDLADIAVAYVQFALARPALFRVMFAEPCHPADAERQGAAGEIEGYLQTLVQRAIPSADPAAMATAVWALVHGLAFLHLDGKYAGSSTPDLRARIRGVVHATLGPHRERSPQPQQPTRC
ncbi:TetR/AcrR family transcriptional regulator [Rhodococcus wratislaviensis]|uniref:TetR/AcrR family transcriptional regulator n=1 Tax=Rhodococcus wratislaviensis TaxID=44752 RepID=UPI003511E924